MYKKGVKPLRTRLIFSGGLLLVAGLICFLVSSLFGWREQEVTAYNPNNLIRLHVIANSNSTQDQELKLKVRDAVLEAATPMLSMGRDDKSAERTINASLNYIEAIARARLSKEGYSYPVRAEYGWQYFPDRRYGEITVPQGRYRSLRLVIGNGVGHNWWCVLFPPMCFSDIQKAQEPVKMKTTAVKIKFRVAEKLQQLGKQRVANR